MNHIRASAMGLAQKCNQSFRVPERKEGEPEEVRVNIGSDDASLGTAFHAVMVDAIRLDATDADALESEILDTAAQCDVGVADLRELVERGVPMWQQIKARWFPAGARVVTEQYLGARVACADLQLTGHVDAHAIDAANKRAVLLDWKTGHRTDADYAGQMLAYALLLASTYDIHEVTALVGWVREGTHGSVDDRTYGVDDLQAGLDNLRALVTATPTYSPGPHCSRCPRQVACPGRREYALAAVRSLGAIAATRTVRDLQPDEAIDLYRKMQHVRQAIEYVQGEFREMLTERGAIHTDGGTLRLQEVARKTINVAAGWADLREMLGDEALAGILKVGITDLKDAIKSTAPRGLKEAAVAAAMDRLQAAGAVDVTATHTIHYTEGDAS